MTDDKRESGGGLSVQTLLISSVSAVVATLVVSQFWEQGTLFFTALVPVAVALTAEALRRPAEKITKVAPPVRARRAPAPRAEQGDPFGLYEPERPKPLERRWVRVGLVTGVVAFLIGAVVVTVSELALFDRSVGGGERRTTLLGGEAEPRATPTPEPVAPEPTPTPAPAEPQATPPPATPAPTTTPAPTATSPPADEETPGGAEAPAP